MPGELTEGTNPQGGCLCALVMPTGMGEMSAWYGSETEFGLGGSFQQGR